ncbi:MAG: hypothetical protein H8E84_02995 [Flavobacteriales bacterium]|nr:hypothetical protein [Flavobacteriales bacterium]
MRNNNYKYSNLKSAYLITAVIFFVGMITLALPLFFIKTFPSSILTTTFTSFPYSLISVFGLAFLLYFIFTGVYFYTFIIDNYIVEIKSKRTISGFFSKKNNIIEMPKRTIVRYAFYNRPFTFNTTLMIKIKLSERKSLAKRFQLSFLTKKQKEKISVILDNIVENNNLNG